MEYLPDDPNEDDPKLKERTEKKLKEFREYIVDKGVVLMLVKVLLSLKYAENKPRNPIKIIRDYFGKYHDPRWDEMSALKEKIILYNNENAKLLEQAMILEDELKNLKRTKRIDKLFDSFELDKNGLISTKTIIELLTGNKKFDVDEKFDKRILGYTSEDIGGNFFRITYFLPADMHNGNADESAKLLAAGKAFSVSLRKAEDIFGANADQVRAYLDQVALTQGYTTEGIRMNLSEFALYSDADMKTIVDGGMIETDAKLAAFGSVATPVAPAPAPIAAPVVQQVVTETPVAPVAPDAAGS